MALSQENTELNLLVTYVKLRLVGSRLIGSRERLLTAVGNDFLYAFAILFFASLIIDKLSTALIVGSAVTSINAVAGRVLFLVAQKKHYFKSGIETVSIGLAFGTAVPALMSAISSLVFQTSLNGQVIFPIMMGAFLFRVEFGSQDSFEKAQIPPVSDTELQACVVLLGTCSLLFAWSWIMVFPTLTIICLLLFIYGGRFKRSLFRFLTFVGVTLVTSRIAVNASGGFWPFEYWIGLDILWDEAWIQRPTTLIFRDPLTYGQNHNVYFLANLWAQDLSHLVGGQSFLVSASLGIIISVVLCVSAIYTFAAKLFGTNSAGAIAVGLFVAQASFPDDWLINEALRVPNFLVLGWTVVFMSLIILREKLQFGSTITVLILGTAIVLGKTPYIFIVLLMVVPPIYMSFREKNFFDTLVLLSIGSIVFVCAILFTLFVSSNRGHSLSAVGFSFSLEKSIVAISVLTLRFLGPHVFRGGRSPRSQLRNASNFANLMLLFILLFSESAGLFLLISAALAVNAVVASNHLLGIRDSGPRRALVSAAFIAGLTMAVTYWTVHIHSVRTIGIVHNLLYQKGPYWYIAISALLCLLVLFFHREDRQRYRAAVTAVVFLNAGLFVGHGFQQLIEKEVYGVGLEYFVSRDKPKLEVASFVKSNSTRDSVIASNSLCPSDAFSEAMPTPRGPNCQSGNVNSWLPAFTKRQAFLEAPLWSSVGLSLDGAEAENYQAVKEYSDGKFDVSLSILKSAGVRYFVFDREGSLNIDYWARCADTVFSNERYFVVDISDGGLNNQCQQTINH